MKIKLARDDDPSRDLKMKWASQIVSRNFVKVTSEQDGVKYMTTKPAGYYIFTKLNKDDNFLLFIRNHNKSTTRYNVTPDGKYKLYILLYTMQGQQGLRFHNIQDLIEHCKHSSRFMEDREEYDMIRGCELHENWIVTYDTESREPKFTTVRSNKESCVHADNSQELEVVLKDLTLTCTKDDTSIIPDNLPRGLRKPTVHRSCEARTPNQEKLTYSVVGGHRKPAIHRSRDVCQHSNSDNHPRRSCIPQQHQRVQIAGNRKPTACEPYSGDCAGYTVSDCEYGAENCADDSDHEAVILDGDHNYETIVDSDPEYEDVVVDSDQDCEDVTCQEAIFGNVSHTHGQLPCDSNVYGMFEDKSTWV